MMLGLELEQIITTQGETPTPMRDDSAPATIPMPAVRVPVCDPTEPTVAEASALLRVLLAAGSVARLDLLHGALVTAYRAGVDRERCEVLRLADESRAQFAEALERRRLGQVAEAARSWWERQQ